MWVISAPNSAKARHAPPPRAGQRGLVHITLAVLLPADAPPLVLRGNHLLGSPCIARSPPPRARAPPAQGPVPTWQGTHAERSLYECANNWGELRGGDSCRVLGELRDMQVRQGARRGTYGTRRIAASRACPRSSPCAELLELFEGRPGDIREMRQAQEELVDMHALDCTI